LATGQDEQDDEPDVYSKNATGVVAEKEGIGFGSRNSVGRRLR